MRLALVAAAPVVAQIVGSAFNIWYNLTQVRPLLSESQHERLVATISVFNVSIYPAATVVWLWVVFRLLRPMRQMTDGTEINTRSRWRARQQVINLPWWIAGIGGIAWLSCIPALIFSLQQLPESLDGRVSTHLAISIILGGMIAVTHGFFAVELVSQRLLFPAFFGDVQPSATRGALPLSLRGRGLVWSVSAGVCPIISLLLLHLMPDANHEHAFLFPMAVGIVAIVFGLTTAWMLGRLYSEPVRELQRAARDVAEGDLTTRVETLRADEFGPLISEFNKMVAGLREGERLRQTFGLHVGREAARQILASDPGLGGVEQPLTVMFVDIRNFTSSSSTRTPQQVVSILNEFLTEMVEVVEQKHGGMVNKYLGDGFMALFGIGNDRDDHADAALQAGADMVQRLGGLNHSFAQRGLAPLGIGIGIHTGVALVGSIGSASRLEFTAIGDTVNVASRVESVTKRLGVSLLITAATRRALSGEWDLVECEPQEVKGVAEPVVTFTLPKAEEKNDVCHSDFM
ncbi:MAG: HAMP domain-containing protein [Planctomycetaceae bacterium]|nr:HAMP domain-containing protein [Planctomycetaceae bacterium]